MRQPLGRAAPRRSGGGHARAGRVLAGRPAVRHACPGLLRRARRGAAAAAVFDAAAQLLRQAQRRCSPAASSAAIANDDYLAYRPSAAAGDPPGGRGFTGGRRGRGSSPGIDGCSAPNYAVPLASLATAFARLASADVDADYGMAPRMLANAMIAHPEMVSGERRSDLALMQAGRGDWVTKIGAEGVQAIGIRSQGLGIAIKVADGQKRGLYPAIVAVLDAARTPRRRRSRRARALGAADGAELPRDRDRRRTPRGCPRGRSRRNYRRSSPRERLNLERAGWSVAASVRHAPPKTPRRESWSRLSAAAPAVRRA